MAIILQSADDSVIAPMTDIEKDLVHKLRAMLKDSPQYSQRTLNTLVEANYGERWSDELLLIYINISMDNFNSSGGTVTAFTVNNFPIGIKGCILMGAFIYALIAESTYQAGETFSYSDNGLSISLDISSKYLSIIGSLKAAYDTSLTTAKQSVARPSSAAIHSAGINGTGSNVFCRSFAQRMWVYR